MNLKKIGRELQYIGGLITINGHVLGFINIVVCLFSPLFEVWVSRSLDFPMRKTTLSLLPLPPESGNVKHASACLVCGLITVLKKGKTAATLEAITTSHKQANSTDLRYN